MVGASTLWAAAGLAVAAAASDKVITNDTYFYGQSPPVYPSRMLSPCPHDMHLTNATQHES